MTCALGGYRFTALHGLGEYFWQTPCERRPATSMVRPEASAAVRREPSGRLTVWHTFYTFRAFLEHVWLGVLVGGLRREIDILRGAVTVTDWWQHPERGAVAVDANPGFRNDATAVTTLSLTTFTMGSVSNGALVALSAFDRTTVTNYGIQWDSAGTPQALSLVISKNSTDACQGKLHGLLAPTSGNKTLKAGNGAGGNWTTSAELILMCVSFSGVDQGGAATSFIHTNSSAGSTANPSIAITSAVGNYTVVQLAAATDFPTLPTQTLIQVVSGAGADNSGGSIGAGAASVTHGFTLTAVAWNFTGCDIAAVGSVGGTDNFDWLKPSPPANQALAAHRPTIVPVP